MSADTSKLPLQGLQQQVLALVFEAVNEAEGGYDARRHRAEEFTSRVLDLVNSTQQSEDEPKCTQCSRPVSQCDLVKIMTINPLTRSGKPEPIDGVFGLLDPEERAYAQGWNAALKATVKVEITDSDIAEANQKLNADLPTVQALDYVQCGATGGERNELGCVLLKGHDQDDTLHVDRYGARWS